MCQSYSLCSVLIETSAPVPEYPSSSRREEKKNQMPVVTRSQSSGVQRRARTPAPRRTRRKTASTTRTTSARTTGADEASTPPSAIQESQQQTSPPTNVAGQESRTWTNAFRRLFGVTATSGSQAVETPVHQRRVAFQSTSSDLNDHHGSEHDVSHTSEPEDVEEQSVNHHHSVRLSGQSTRSEDADQQQDSEQPESNQEVLEQVPDDQRSSSRDQHSPALSRRSRSWDSWIPDYSPTSPVPSSTRSPVRPATSPRPQSNRSDGVRSPNYTSGSPRPPSRRSDRTAMPPTDHAHHAISPRSYLAPPEPDSIHIRWDIRCMEELFGRPQMIIQFPIGITFEYGPDVRNGLWCAPMWLDPSTDMDDERQEGILRRLGSWPRRIWVTRRTYRGWWHVEMTHVLGGCEEPCPQNWYQETIVRIPGTDPRARAWNAITDEESSRMDRFYHQVEAWTSIEHKKSFMSWADDVWQDAQVVDRCP